MSYRKGWLIKSCLVRPKSDYAPDNRLEEYADDHGP